MQIVAVASTYALAIVGTIVILKVVDALVGLRVSAEDEMAGLDLSQHSETAYSAGGGFGEFERRPAAWASPCAPPRASPGWRIEPARPAGLDSPSDDLKVGGLFITQHRRSRA